MIPLHYGDNKPKYKRWAIYCALLAIAVLLQNSIGGILDFFGARVFLSIPLCVAIAMFEREVPAAVFGVFAGVLWDVSSGVDGFNAVLLMAISSVSSLFISHLMRNNIITSFVLGAGGIASYELVYFITRFWGSGNPIRQIISFYLPSLIITLVFVPVCYIVVKSVYNSYRIAE